MTAKYVIEMELKSGFVTPLSVILLLGSSLYQREPKLILKALFSLLLLLLLSLLLLSHSSPQAFLQWVELNHLNLLFRLTLETT